MTVELKLAIGFLARKVGKQFFSRALRPQKTSFESFPQKFLVVYAKAIRRNIYEKCAMIILE